MVGLDNRTLFRSPSYWRELLQSDRASSFLATTYGSHAPESVLKLRRVLLLKGIDEFVAAHPSLRDANVGIVRCPGRVNLRGMHIDSHGGACNSIATDRETVIMFVPTEDPTIKLPFESKYVDAVLKEYGPISKGFTGVCVADLPQGCGLSSSHSFIMALLLALATANGCDVLADRVSMIEKARLVEFRAGKVTGLGDQGAMAFARCGHVVHATFFQEDFDCIKPQSLPFPVNDCHILVANSLCERDLSGNAAVDYAVPRFAYSIGLALLRRVFQNLYHLSEEEMSFFDRLSRFNKKSLARFGGDHCVFELLRALPEVVSTQQLLSDFPDLAHDIEAAEAKYLAKLAPEVRPSTYDIRGALLFGMAECSRATAFADLLRQVSDDTDNDSKSGSNTGLLKQLGQLMCIGHYGDSKGKCIVTNDYLDGLIGDLSAQLCAQPGDFRASTPRLDELQQAMMDAGALGASLTGAGLGGVVVAMVGKDQLQTVTAAVARVIGTDHPEAVFTVFPVHGAARLQAPDLSTEAVPSNSLSAVSVPTVKKQILVTGGAGFIGSHVATHFARNFADTAEVHVIDDCNDYYDPLLKFMNLRELTKLPNVHFHFADIRDVASVNAALANVQQIDLCVHLAARAGVRPSLTNPQLYIDTNVHGTRHVIEHCERKGCRAFVYASSSSVYGSQPSELPFTEDIPLCPPESPYAQTKVDNEVFASRFANEHENLALAGLRFFTVDGPMLCGVPGRPDMAIASFIRMIASGTAVTMYGDGSYKRDFSFVQDIVQGIVKSAEWCENVSNQTGRHEVFNLGEEDCTSVHDVILMLASEMGVKFDGTMEGLIRQGVVTSVPPPKGDVPHTHANVSKARRLLGYDPHCKIAENIRRTVRAMHSVPWLPSQVTHVLRSLRDSSIVIAPEEAMSVLRERCEVEPDVSLWPILLEHFAQR